jgi:ankyrin repeat protein
MSDKKNNVYFGEKENSNSNNEKKKNTAKSQNQTKKKRSAAAQARRAAKWASQKTAKKAETVAKQETKKAEKERKARTVLEMFPDILGIVGAQGFMPNIKTKSLVLSKNVSKTLKNVRLFQNADRSTVYPNGRTVLSQYLIEGNWDKAKETLEKGVSKKVLETPIPGSYKPFVYAYFYSGRFDLFMAFLNARDDPNQTIFVTKNNEVPFLTFIIGELKNTEEKKMDYIEALLEKGANINAKSSQGETALEIALIAQEDKIAKLLIENGADFMKEKKGGFYPLLTAIAKNNIPLVELMLSKADVNLNKKTGEKGLFPLKIAVLNGGIEILKYLLQNKVNVNLQDELGNTALHYAVLTHNYNKIGLLIDAGASPQIKNKKGDSALKLAEKFQRLINPKARMAYQELKSLEN